MNQKRLKIISTIGIFLLCFLTHYVYEWVPNDLFAIIFPVNESIWEHMKMIYTTIILFGIIEIYIIKKYNIKTNNYTLNLFITSILNIIIYLIIYLPVYYKVGSNMFITLLILLISIVLTEVISYYILKMKNFKHQKVIGVTFILIGYIIFGYLTYKPIKNDIFFDKQHEKYGINIYNIE